MKAQCIAMIALAGFLLAGSLVSPKPLNAQASTAAEKAQIPPRTTLAGSWKFNRNDSDDPMQEVRSVESQTNIEAGGSGYPAGGSYPSNGGYGGGGFGPPGTAGRNIGGNPSGNTGYPGSTSSDGMPRSTGYDIEDNPRMQPLIHPPQTLTVDQKDSEIDVTGDRLYELMLFTDRHQLPKKSTDDNHEQVAAHWNGSQLVSDEKSPLGGKMSRTFELSKDGRKLLETLHIENRHAPALNLRYVYDASDTGVSGGQAKNSHP